MPRLCHTRGLHNSPTPPSRLLITTVPPQLRIAAVPTSRVRIPIMRFPLHLAALHICISLNDCRDATSLANIAS